jgi:thymidylate kinase
MTGPSRSPAADEPAEEVGQGIAETSSDSDWVPGFLGILLHALDEEGVRWLIMRNYEDLPHHVGHDVDLLIHPKDAPRIFALMRSVVERCGLFLLRTYRGIEHDSFDVAPVDLLGRLMLRIDFHTAARHRGRFFIRADDFLAARRRVDDMWVPAPGMEAYALILHAALHKGELKEEYSDRLEALEAMDPGSLERVASEQLGAGLARQLASVRTEPQLLALRKQLGRALDRHHPQNLWLRPWYRVRSGFGVVRLRLRPTGLFVVFIGPDGSGKTSTTDLLVQMLKGHRAFLPIHRVYLGSGKPILPTRKLIKQIRKKTGRAKDKSQLRDVSPRRLRGAIHVLADEVLRYWIQVWPRLYPHRIVIADRYAYDVLRVNNATVRSPRFRRLATMIIPEPHITFFLEGDPEVVAARKHELSVPETIRQQVAYRELAGYVGTFHSLDLSTRDRATLRGVAMEVLRAYAVRNGGAPPAENPKERPASGL